MSELAISLKGVSKSFRRFQHPGWRALDALGLPISSKRYDVFTALNDISLDIARGEKVALIGRNGAGKSTLLRLISRQMKSDRGEIHVNGQIQALMGLGTGFHPDFNGIQNIRSALAYQGISTMKVSECIDEIADFTELDDFLWRPVKEYSSGMYARLAFAVATSITPDILIIDEVLGAGDAYFMGKCIQRMKALTSQGATILFVSHDISSVQMLCDRGVWLEHGAIRQDGDLLPVSKAYLACVREEEEKRVKAKSMSLTRGQVSAMMSAHTEITLLRLIGADGTAPEMPFTLSSIDYGDETGRLGKVALTTSGESESRLIYDPQFMNWKLGKLPDGQNCWMFGNYGGRYLHAPFQITWPKKHLKAPWVEMVFRESDTSMILLEQFDAKTESYRTLSSIPPVQTEAWSTLRIPLSDTMFIPDMVTSLLEDLPQLSEEDRYGSGEAVITGFAFFDDEQTQRYTLISGEPAYALLAFSTDQIVTAPVPVIAVYRPDGTCAMQVVASRDGYFFDKISGRGAIRVTFSPLLLGPGDYLVSVALFRELNLASAIEPAAYDLHDRCYALKVLPPPGVQVEIGVVNQSADWELIQ